MRVVTLRELEEIMRRCAGEDEFAQPVEQAPDRPFEELGYDSLALLETHNRIKRDYSVEISEEEFADAQTPQELVELINGRLNTA